MSVDPKQRLLKNVFSNYASMFLNILIAFFVTPFLVTNLGKEQYGIWALIFSIVGYMNFFDMGMKQSLARFIPKYYAVKDYKSLNEIMSSGFFIYFISSILIACSTLLIAFFFTDQFNISEQYAGAMRVALIIVGLNVAITFFSLIGTSLGPFHRYDIANAVEIMRLILRTALIVYFVYIGYGIIALAVITISTNMLNLLARKVAQKKLIPEAKIDLKLINKKRIREMLEYGVVSFLIVICWMIIFNTGNIIAGAVISATAVTFYSIAITIINYLRSIISSISVPLTPAISHIDTIQDKSEIISIYYKLIRYLYYLTSCISAGLLIFGGSFIYLWMGPDFGKTVNVLYILTIPVCIYLPQMMANAVLFGIGKHRVLLYVLLGEAASNIILSLILVHFYGIYGIAIGMALPQLIIYIFIYPIIFHRIISHPVKEFYLIAVKMVTIGAVFTVPISLIISQFYEIRNWLEFFTIIGIVTIVIITGFWFVILKNEDKARLRNMINRRTNK